MKSSHFLTLSQQEAIVSAIKQAEHSTSGEIRVHIENSCKMDVLDRAAFIFKKLNMHKTNLRNGVLFYVAVKDKKFAIIGDAGIHAKVPADFWENIKKVIHENIVAGNLTEGLIKGIIMTGEHLKQYFPYKKDDVNELPDEISFGR